MGYASELIIYIIHPVSQVRPGSPNAYLQNIFLLVVTAVFKFGLTAYTFGLKVCF